MARRLKVAFLFYPAELARVDVYVAAGARHVILRPRTAPRPAQRGWQLAPHTSRHVSNACHSGTSHVPFSSCGRWRC